MPLFEGAFPKRPSFYDDAVINAAAEKIGRELAKSWGEDEQATERVIEDLKEALDSIYDIDGYKIAKELDSMHCYELSSRDVEILDETYWAMSCNHRKLVKAWVRKHDIKAKLKVGDKVWHTNQVPRLKDAFPEGVEVEIVKVDEAEYKYGVFHSDLCVREGEGCGTLSFIVPCEKIDFVGETKEKTNA